MPKGWLCLTLWAAGTALLIVIVVIKTIFSKGGDGV